MGCCQGWSPGWLTLLPPTGMLVQAGWFQVSAFGVFSCLGHFLFFNTFPIAAKQQKRKLVSLLLARRAGVGGVQIPPREKPEAGLEGKRPL